MSSSFARICYILRLRSGGLLGSTKRYLEADVATIEQRYGDKTVPCIPSTYMKGLVRRTLEALEDLLIRANIIAESITHDLFGAMLGIDKINISPTVIPSKITFGSALPVADISVAKKFSQSEPLSYMCSNEILSEDISYYVEPHVRICDPTSSVSEGGLFHEYKLAPRQLFYGEILIHEKNEERLKEFCRAILISLMFLNYLYVGRSTTTADVVILSVAPPSLLQDAIISQILKISKEIIKGWASSSKRSS